MRKPTKGPRAGWPSGLAMLALAMVLAAPAEAKPQPIVPHPDNPRYSLFEGRPMFLITSGEHSGAVLNLDFDDVSFLDELHARGFNLIRLFSGTYHEVAGSFQIRDNTLALPPGRYVGAWPRAETPGAADGGAKFDPAAAVGGRATLASPALRGRDRPAARGPARGWTMDDDR